MPRNKTKRVVLAYSGGLDTSVVTRWLVERGWEVVCLYVDVGFSEQDAGLEERALAAGAERLVIEDAKDTFARAFIFPALKAGALYEGRYPLATALARPLIAKLLVDVARAEGATAVAHGCTGKGNDQVRFDVSVAALAPDLKVIAPAREWDMTDRMVEIAYAKKHGIPVPVTVDKPYSVDANLWGKSIEGGILEDPSKEPPEDVYGWTRSVKDTPEEAAYVQIGFERGMPVSLDGETLDGVALVRRLNTLAGEHGVGRIDHIEDRLVGIKSREIYEAPAAIVLTQAHQAVESLTLAKDQLRFKARVSQEYSELIYNGLWFTGMRHDLEAYVRSTQRNVSGQVRVRLHRAKSVVVGREAKASLYQVKLSTYGDEDAFDHTAAEGFIKIWGLPVRTQAEAQGQNDAS